MDGDGTGGDGGDVDGDATGVSGGGEISVGAVVAGAGSVFAAAAGADAAAAFSVDRVSLWCADTLTHLTIMGVKVTPLAAEANTNPGGSQGPAP